MVLGLEGCGSMSTTQKGTAIGAGGGAALGAAIGAIIGKGKGAAIGAAVGTLPAHSSAKKCRSRPRRLPLT